MKQFRFALTLLMLFTVSAFAQLSPGGGGGGGGSVTQGTVPWVDTMASWGSTPVTLGGASAWGTPPTGNVIGANVNCLVGCSGSTAIVSWGGGTLGAMANYGTSPGAVLVPGVNANVTNVNANGSATSANSSPVVIASDQSPVHSSLDPCAYSKKSTAFFNITASGASFITATAADYTYICQITVTTSTQTNFSIVAGTGSSVCTGGTPYPIFGNPAETAANGALIGVSATVGGGIVVGNGEATVAGGSVGGTVNYNLCALITTTNSPTVNGTILYVQTAS